MSDFLRTATRWPRLLIRRITSISADRLPRGSGVAATTLLLALTAAYGAVKGNHVQEVIDGVLDARDAVANAAGFRIAALAIGGQKQVTREEILATAGITGHASLLFFVVDAARAKLKTNPWIADATVLKLYPDRLQITVTEREPFALWQKDGKVSVIAEDGTVLEPYVARRFATMPLIVGRGAQLRAKEFLALLDRHPDLRDEVRASILVAERRWNLRLRNGMDVRLPEFDVDKAVEALLTIDRDKKLFARDITAVDMRLPDRVTVRLSDAAAKAREDALKDKKKKAKGTDA
jgi:cell division protein FtsQ